MNCGDAMPPDRKAVWHDESPVIIYGDNVLLGHKELDPRLACSGQNREFQAPAAFQHDQRMLGAVFQCQVLRRKRLSAQVPPGGLGITMRRPDGAHWLSRFFVSQF